MVADATTPSGSRRVSAVDPESALELAEQVLERAERVGATEAEVLVIAGSEDAATAIHELCDSAQFRVGQDRAARPFDGEHPNLVVLREVMVVEEKVLQVGVRIGATVRLGDLELHPGPRGDVQPKLPPKSVTMRIRTRHGGKKIG